MTQEKPLSPTAQIWTEKLKQWKSSGKSGAQWCRDNQESYKVFSYWRFSLGYGEKKKSSPQCSAFTELPQTSSQKDVGLEVRIKNTSIILHRNFDPQELLRCVQALGGLC